MSPKNFRAPTPKQVLSKISRELGPDAIIVSHREIQDSKGKLWVEAIASPNVEEFVPESIPLITNKITRKLSLKKLSVLALVFITIAALFLLSVFLIKILPSRNPILPAHKQIVFTGNSYSPAVSPDGKFIAYVNYETFDEQRLMVQDIASGKAIEVFSEQEIWALRWLPDGSELSFCAWKDDEGAIFVVPRLGGTARRLKYAPYFAWSPDGSRIARTWVTWKKITITNESSGETTSIPIKDSFTWIRGIDWSPIGSFFLFITKDDENRFAVWTISADGKTQHKVVEDDVFLYSPCWSPRGDAIFYLRRKGMQRELWKIPVSTDTGKPTKSASLVLPDLQAGDFFTITSDGTKMLYTREIRSSNLWLATVEESGKGEKVRIEQLTRGTLNNVIPSISPDGKLIAFSRGDAKICNIYVMPVQGGNPKQITFLNSVSNGQVWSPDGNEIAFGSKEGGEFKVWKVNVNDGRPFKFAQSKLSSYYLAWFPGDNILYHRPGNRNFFILNPVTEEEKPLIEDDSVGWVFLPRYSPDGKKVAVMWNRRPYRGLWVIPLEDSAKAFFLKEKVRPVGWSEDGRWIYAAEEIPGTLRILKISIKGNQTKIILTIPFTLEEGFPNSSGVGMTPDGKKFVFSVKKRHSDVWMVENFDPEMR